MARAAKACAVRSIVRDTLNFRGILVSKKPNYRDVDTPRKLCHLCRQLMGRPSDYSSVSALGISRLGSSCGQNRILHHDSKRQSKAIAVLMKSILRAPFG
jgi:hypothetical protein